MRIIGIFSNKGGVGKTFLSINLSSALAMLKNYVTLIDASFGNPNVSIALGIYNQNSIIDAITQNKKIRECIYYSPYGFKILPGSLNIYDSIKSFNFEYLFNYFADDFLIIDTESGFDERNLKILNACNEIILVTLPEFPAIFETLKLLEIAKNKKILAIVVNRVRNKKEIEKVKKYLEFDNLIFLPEDKRVREMYEKKVPFVNLYPNSILSCEILNFASLISGNTITFKPSLEERIKSFFGFYK